MTDDRYNALMDHIEQGLHAEEIAEGWHFCYDWDGLLIAPHMGEWEACCCDFGDFPKPVYCPTPETPKAGSGLGYEDIAF